MDDQLFLKTKPPQVTIKTEEQATNYVVGLVAEMSKCRISCSLACQNKATSVGEAQRMSWVLLNKQGQVVGALNAFRLAGLISERVWIELHQKAINALAPTIDFRYNTVIKG